MFIKVETFNGRQALLNINHIIRVDEVSDRVIIFLRDELSIHTKESLSQIKLKINEAEGS